MGPGPGMIAALQFGDVGEYLFGAATVGALVWAIFETRRARTATIRAHEQTERALAMQAARDQLETEIGRRRQAALVACSIVVSPTNLQYLMWNYSSAPIFEVRWFLVTGPGSTVVADKSETKTLGPGDTHATTFPFPMDLARRVERLTGITFRDNAGLDWVKWSDGRLGLRHTDFTDQIAGETAWPEAGPVAG